MREETKRKELREIITKVESTEWMKRKHEKCIKKKRKLSGKRMKMNGHGK